MKERGILFSAPMVKAILAGTKTQTRRIVSPEPDGDPICDSDDGRWYVDGSTWCRACPYGAAGDRLWVRETWYYFGGDEYIYQRDPSAVSYRADENWPPSEVAWRPSIFMPRWASRITLEITAVRVERLQEITDEDAEAEGVLPPPGGYQDGGNPVLLFRTLWDSINGRRAPWASSPWVWVISFRRVQP